MIPAKDQLFTLNTTATGKLIETITKIGWSHAGIATKLIDLIGGRLHQQYMSLGLGQSQCSFQHKWVS
ncbi:hypothetical protein D3C84_1208570 [compost metagenome]